MDVKFKKTLNFRARFSTVRNRKESIMNWIILTFAASLCLSAQVARPVDREMVTTKQLEQEEVVEAPAPKQERVGAAKKVLQEEISERRGAAKQAMEIEYSR